MSSLLDRITSLRDDAVAFADQHSQVSDLDNSQRQSAINLLHYLSLRQHDLRSIQQELIELGLTSLGILEAHTLVTLNQVINWLRLLEALPPEVSVSPPVDVSSSAALLKQRAGLLFGKPPAARDVRIMVTMPTESADDPWLVENLLLSGMDVMRINCAHDDAMAWERMIDNLERAKAGSSKSCRVQIDLAGPKLRTGSIEGSGRVKKIKPDRNIMGKVIMPARFWLVSEAHPYQRFSEPAIEVDGNDFDKAKKGDRLILVDARDVKRKLKIVKSKENALLIESDKTLYVLEGAEFHLQRRGKKVGLFTAVNVQQTIEPILLQRGDQLHLTREPVEGTHAEHDEEGELVSPAQIHCTLPEAFEHVQENQAVWFDDGKIGGIVDSNDGSVIEVQITQVPPGGGRLRSGKGINFPETLLHSRALTHKDREDLKQLKDRVDMVALSFVQTADDVADFQRYLVELGKPDLGIIIKIETKPAFENLPGILLQALKSPCMGVMIARGDLAVEVGFKRLSEIQEEIIWLCESAHVPVIWATQILEGLVKKGAPSRAEITDAAASIRAECAMLNKGPNLTESVAFFDGLLRKMETHYHKRRLMMRPLQVCMSDLPFLDSMSN